jgi:hypothetical protein
MEYPAEKEEILNKEKKINIYTQALLERNHFVTQKKERKQKEALESKL